MTVVELTGSKAVVQSLASRDALWWGSCNPNLWLAPCDIVWKGNIAVVQSLASPDALWWGVVNGT